MTPTPSHFPRPHPTSPVNPTGRRRRAPGPCRRAAFTLLELVLVMVLICIALAMAAPNLAGFMHGSRQRDVAMQVTALAHWARTQAVSEGRVYRLSVEDGGKTYFVTCQDGNQFVRPIDNPDMAQQFTTPDDVTITLQRDDATNTEYVDFFPDGRCDTGTFHVTLSNRDESLVTCATPTEQYRVVPPSEINRQ